MRILTLAALATLLSASARAQTTETPIAFDSAQRVLAVTPAMAQRLGLTPPVWPAGGAYTEARLYAVSPGGGFTLVVYRSAGVLERYALSSSDRTSLGGAIDSAMKVAGRFSGELATDVVSVPAGNAFARRLTIHSALFYGPLAASLANGGSGAGALYLLTTGLTYFVSYGAAQSNSFTRAQSDLAGDLGLAAAGAGLLAGYALTGEGGKEVRALSLGGAVVGTIAGASLAKGMSDAEAHGAITGIEAGAAAAVAAVGLAGSDKRSMSGAAIIGGAIGYPLGAYYPKHAGYNLTAGDVEAIGTSALIGIAFAGATLPENASTSRIAATLGAGYLAGAFVGERLIARPFNLTQSQANVLKVGAVAGGLVGLALPVLGQVESPSVVLTAIGAGATLGVAALIPGSASAAAPAGGRAPGGSPGGFRLSVSPGSLFGLATRTAGRHSLVRIVF